MHYVCSNQTEKWSTEVDCVALTFEGFGWCFSAAGSLWNEHSLSKHLDIKACIVKGHLGVFLQLLGQVGSRRGGHRVGPVAAVLRDLQLFHETHGPGGGAISDVLSQQRHDMVVYHLFLRTGTKPYFEGVLNFMFQLLYTYLYNIF